MKRIFDLVDVRGWPGVAIATAAMFYGLYDSHAGLIGLYVASAAVIDIARRYFVIQLKYRIMTSDRANSQFSVGDPNWWISTIVALYVPARIHDEDLGDLLELVHQYLRAGRKLRARTILFVGLMRVIINAIIYTASAIPKRFKG
jgi:hypothetical protein